MGDRCNIRVAQDGGASVYLYAHWEGHCYARHLQAALRKGKDRWTDEPYLTRIIFNELQGNDRGLTGFGITTYLTDNEHPILVVDVRKQAVSTESDERPHRTPRVPTQWTFAEYIALPPDSLDGLIHQTAVRP